MTASSERTPLTLIVSAEYADCFRAALVAEIATDAQGVMRTRAELLEEMAGPGRHLDILADDLRNVIGMLEDDVALVDRVGLQGPGEIEVRPPDVSTLAHVCETMAKQLGQRLAEALDVGPLDAAYAGKLRPLIDELSWAVDRAAELHQVAGRERAEVA